MGSWKFYEEDRLAGRLMKRARVIAREGACNGWYHVLAQMEREGASIRILENWAKAPDRAQIDLLCRRARPMPETRPAMAAAVIPAEQRSND
jgi:hypothetical protein